MGRVQVLEQRPVREAQPPPAAPAVRSSRLLGALPVAAALALWGASLPAVQLDQLSGLGLLDAVPPAWFAAFAVLIAGFARQVTRPVPDTPLLALYVIALVVMIHATTPLLYDQPRYVWTYKHLGPIAFIDAYGSIDRSIDLYHNWPAFFALNAWLSDASGVSPIRYAEWSQLFFELANVAALTFAVRGLTRDPRVVWTTAWFFIVANWIGQDYLAPQALAFLLALVVIGVCLRCVPMRGPHEAYQPPLTTAGALVVGGLGYLAVVVTHQFSPVLLIAGVAALALAGQRVPLRVMTAMVAIEAWWVALAWPELNERFNLLEPDPTRTPTPRGDPGWVIADAELVRYGQLAVVAVIGGLAALGFVRRMRAGRRDDRPVALVVAFVVVGLVQTYGGESLLRVFLFGLPWLAFLAAEACVGDAAAVTRGWARHALAVLAATAAVAAGFMVAFYGRELENHVLADDIAASLWLEARPPEGRSTVRAGPQLPNRLTAAYPRNAAPPARILSSDPDFWRRSFDGQDMARLASELRVLHGPDVYLIVTPSQEANARLFGLAPPGGFERLTRALLASPDFTLVHRRGRGYVFWIQPAAAPAG